VLGGGLDRVYPPEHASLYTAIAPRDACCRRGTPGAMPMPFRFPARNRVLAALGDVTVVVQADAQSGSRHTVRAALALGRLVRLVPWPLDHPAYAGNAAWTARAQGRRARLGRRAGAACRRGLGGETARGRSADDRARLEQALAAGPRTLDALARASGLAIAAAARAATALEIAGRIERTGGDRYRRRPH
jgi:DNA processing protein